MFTQSVLSGFNQKGTPIRTAAEALNLKRNFNTVNRNLRAESILGVKSIKLNQKVALRIHHWQRTKTTQVDEIMFRTEKLKSEVPRRV